MRLPASLALMLVLSACAGGGASTWLGNPADGWTDFIGDTVTFRSNPNAPVAESDTIRRAMGLDVETETLQSEAGNIWPAMPTREPSAAALEKTPTAMNTPPAAAPARPLATPAPATPAPAAPPPVVQAAPPPAAPRPTPIPLVSGSALPTPAGAAILNVAPSGIMNYTLPNGATGRAIDNGNGTVTLIGADGQVMTVPAAR